MQHAACPIEGRAVDGEGPMTYKRRAEPDDLCAAL